MKATNRTVYICDHCKKEIISKGKLDAYAKYTAVAERVPGVKLDDDIDFPCSPMNTFNVPLPRREPFGGQSQGAKMDILLQGTFDVGLTAAMKEVHLCDGCAEEFIDEYFEILNDMSAWYDKVKSC